MDFAIAIAVEWWASRQPEAEPARQRVEVVSQGSGALAYQGWPRGTVVRGRRGRPRWFGWSGQFAVIFVSLLVVGQVAQSSVKGAPNPHIYSSLTTLTSSGADLLLSVPATTGGAFVQAAPDKPAWSAQAPVEAASTAVEQEPVVEAAAAVVAPAPNVEQAPAAAPPPPVVVNAPVYDTVPGNLTADEVASYALAAGWPAALIPEVQDVAWCESRFSPGAVGNNALGLMQIWPGWFTSLGLADTAWSDPVVNLQVAKHIYDRGVANGTNPWGPWGCRPG